MAFVLSLPLLIFCFPLHRLAGGVDGSNASSAPLTPIARDVYHLSDSLLDEVKALVHRHPEKLMVETMRMGNKGYSAEIMVVTYNHSKREVDQRMKYRIVISFGQHGRELVTSEVALRLLSILSGEHAMQGKDPGSLNNVLDNLVIKVVPMENLNGRKLVEAGDLCERRNGRGVDLNRNWSVDWGKKEEDYDPYEENPGTAPFSEPETQIMRDLLQSFNPHIWVNVHSGMEALFMPYDHKNATPDDFTSDLSKELLVGLNHRYCQDRCLVGSGGGSVGYLAHGTSTDYMYDVLKVPMSFTFEIYGDLSASSKDCFKMFNPVDGPALNKILETWSASLLTLFETGPLCLEKARLAAAAFSIPGSKWVSMEKGGARVSGASGGSEGRNPEWRLELGLQELTYFRLLMLSSVVIVLIFCSRLSGSKCPQMARDHCPTNF